MARACASFSRANKAVSKSRACLKVRRRRKDSSSPPRSEIPRIKANSTNHLVALPPKKIDDTINLTQPEPLKKSSTGGVWTSKNLAVAHSYQRCRRTSCRYRPVRNRLQLNRE